MTPLSPVPGLTRDLCRHHGAPDQVRGGVFPAASGSFSPVPGLTRDLRRHPGAPDHVRGAGKGCCR